SRTSRRVKDSLRFSLSSTSAGDSVRNNGFPPFPLVFIPQGVSQQSYCIPEPPPSPDAEERVQVAHQAKAHERHGKRRIFASCAKFAGKRRYLSNLLGMG